jgi:hypothetical protein
MAISLYPCRFVMLTIIIHDETTADNRKSRTAALGWNARPSVDWIATALWASQ